MEQVSNAASNRRERINLPTYRHNCPKTQLILDKLAPVISNDVIIYPDVRAENFFSETEFIDISIDDLKVINIGIAVCLVELLYESGLR